MAKRVVAKLSLIEKTKNAALARNTARLAELTSLIRRRVTEVVEGFYDIGEALREIVDHKLYAVVGHSSFKRFLTAEKLLSPRQAAKLVAVVRKVPRDEALRLGQERAYALVAYTDATPEDDSPAALVAANAKVDGKPVAAASLRDIEAATRSVRAKTRRPQTDAQRAKAKADDGLAKTLRAALRDAGIGRATVAVGRDEVRVTLTRAQVERLARKR